MSRIVYVTVTNDNNEQQSLKTTLQTTVYMLKLVLTYREGKVYALLTILSSLLDIFPLMIATIFPGLIINELLRNPHIYTLVLYVFILIFVPVFHQIINRFVKTRMNKIRLYL